MDGIGISEEMSDILSYAAEDDADKVVSITKKINGGTNGLASRKMFLARAMKAL